MGELDNTFIFYTADHGMAIGRHGLQGKQNLYEHTWRVPFIVKGPGIKAGSRTKGNIYLLDVLSTLCDIAGIEPARHVRDFGLCAVMGQDLRARCRDHRVIAADMVVMFMGVQDLRDRPAIALGRGEAFFVIQRIDSHGFAGIGTDDQVVEVTVCVSGPDLFDDHGALLCIGFALLYPGVSAHSSPVFAHAGMIGVEPQETVIFSS